MMKNRVRTVAMMTLALIAIVSHMSVASQTIGKKVKVQGGTLEGAVSGDVLSFKGIPYAAPPIGDLRWRAPQPVKPWKGVRKATAFGHDCVQKAIPGDAAASGSTTAEDCLVLNVWRPATAKSGENLPVMVWIHGGGYLNGGSSAAIFDGSAFARQGLVLVSLNYRLGRMGFFAHPALTAAKEEPLGNYGLMDQLAALRWVRRNIAAFGGNPDQVTIVSESAGGISVMHLLTWPEAKGLFHRAAVMSGGGRTYLVGLRKLSEATPQLPSAEESGVEFAKSMGITGTGAAALKALRALPADKVDGDMNMGALITKPPTYAGGPIFDGKIVTATPGEILRRGEAAQVPIIIGTTTDDLPVTYAPSRENPLSYFGPDAERARAVYNPGGTLQTPQLASTVAVDITMHEPARFVATQMVAAGNPVWLYRFGYVAASLRPKQTGAKHASELPYLFRTLDARYGQEVTAQDREASRAFHTYFVNFVQYGDPNGQGLPPWPPFAPEKSDLMHFTPDNGPRLEADPWKERLDLVERAADAPLSHPDAARHLGGTSWQLVKFQGGDDTTLTPDDTTKYTIAFGTDGRVSVRIDCNRGRSTWTSSGPHQLQFGPMALTRAMCPPGSLHDRMARDWELVRSYTIKNGHLFLSLMADGGTYEFEPMGGSHSAAPQSPGATPSGDIDQYRRYYVRQSNEEPKNGAIKVTFLGTTTLLFDDGETQLMIDGFFSRPPLSTVAASTIQTDTAAVDAALSRAKVERLKALFVAHSHYDHALDAAYVVQRTHAKLYGSASTLNVGRGGGLTEDQLTLYEPGKEITFGQFTVTILLSKHSLPVPGVNDDLGVAINQPLRQPAKASDYTEGGSFDMLIRHGDHAMLVKPSAHYIEGALDNVRADVFFLATATLGSQAQAFREAFYDQTVGTVRPTLVIPMHWDNFFLPLHERLEPRNAKDVSADFDFLIGRLSADGITFAILQGYQSVMLFGQGAGAQGRTP